MDRDEVIGRLEKNFRRTLPHFGAPDDELEKSYAAGKWSARMVLAHLADVEFINLWRFCRAVAEPGSHVEPFEEDAWARALVYATRPASASGELYAGARGMLLQHARTLPEAALDASCDHPQKGRMTGWDWLKIVIDHGDHHLGQVEAARRGVAWTPEIKPDSWRYGAAKPA